MVQIADLNLSPISKAKLVAELAHEGQFRKDRKTPYIVHPEQVAQRASKHGEDCEVVAWLHDVIEDNPDRFSQAELLEWGFESEIIDAVVLLTHDNKNIRYAQYLIPIKENELARLVKICDIQTNISDNPTRSQMIKYAKALLFLLQ